MPRGPHPQYVAVEEDQGYMARPQFVAPPMQGTHSVCTAPLLGAILACPVSAELDAYPCCSWSVARMFPGGPPVVPMPGYVLPPGPMMYNPGYPPPQFEECDEQ